MFCPKCGTNLKDTDEFCSKCGTNLKKYKMGTANKTPEILDTNSAIDEGKTNTENNINQDNMNQNNISQTNMNQNNISQTNMNQNNEHTMVDTLSIKIGSIVNKIVNKIKSFSKKYKKQITIGLAVCLVIFIGVFLFNKFYDFTKISWDKNGDGSVNYTQATTLNLNVLAYDKEKKPIYDIKFSTDDGKIVADGSKVKWTLPSKEGSYTIVAMAPSGKKITKAVKVVELDDSNEQPKNLAGMIEVKEEDEKLDSDNDGITDKEEKKLKTDIYSADSDEDGLPDKLEIEVVKTDPLKKDTDGDKISDGDEMDLGLDPLKSDSKDDGIKDSDRTLTYTINEEELGITMEIKGKGNIASTTIDVIKNSTFTDIDGLMDTILNFYTTGDIDSASVTIKYDAEEIKEKGLDEDNLTLYYFNEKTKKLEIIPTVVDKVNKTLSVTLKHFSKYVVGDKNAVLTDYISQLMFVIDNSVSMYSEAQMKAAGFNNSQGAIENDIEFKRLSLTNKLIDMFTGNYEFGVAEFSGNYVNLSRLSNDTSKVKKAVNSMKNNWHTNGNGTDIITALEKGIAEFKKDDNSHYLILMTDGKNTNGYLPSRKSTIIENAKEKDVKVCVIGLGNKIDTNALDDIAEETGCDYYNASDSSALDEIYSIVGSNINYNLVDTDNNSKTDGMIDANSGFIVTRDGFSFKNFRSDKSLGGHCYGMATLAMLYYTKQLPLSLPAMDTTKFYLLQGMSKFKSNGYDLNNTFIDKGENLFDYKITNEGLKIFLNDIPGDYRDRVENDTWMIKKEYYNKMKEIGATFSIEKNKDSSKEFSKYQSALLNIDNDKFNSAVVRDESQLINAIWRLFILQAHSDERTSFSASPDEAFEELKTELNNKNPMVISVDGKHAVNAIRLIQDINDSNKFKIEVYDNNYPGKVRYIDVVRSKFSKFALNVTAWTNEYNYKFNYDMEDDGDAEKLTVDLIKPIIK